MILKRNSTSWVFFRRLIALAHSAPDAVRLRTDVSVNCHPHAPLGSILSFFAVEPSSFAASRFKTRKARAFRYVQPARAGPGLRGMFQVLADLGE